MEIVPQAETQNGVSIVVLHSRVTILQSLTRFTTMPDLQDRVYCSEQIHIPPTFPYIMKLYCKAAIRTQPYDLLRWSAAYFRALAKGEEPPVKERVEYPPYDSPSGLTPGYIKILINQFGKDPTTTVTAQTLFNKWRDICLDEHLLIKLIALMGAYTTVNWVNFVGVCAGFISKTLTQTMILICELFTEEPEGGMATVPYGFFIDLYTFLAQMDCGPLTEAEQLELDAITGEEDVCEVADKIRQEEYEGEVLGEYIYGEEMEGEIREPAVEEEEEEEKSSEEEEKEVKVQEQPPKKEESEVNEFRERPPKKNEEPPKEEAGEDDEDLEAPSDTTFLGDQDSYKSITSAAGGSSQMVSTLEEEHTQPQTETSAESLKKEAEEEAAAAAAAVAAAPTEEAKSGPRKINLEELEDSIREKIEERLAAESETVMEEDDREFEDLGSYLLGASARVKKFTADTLGFKIFRKYMRQEVPGIGPVVEAEQVEKVVDFLDFWSHKQELMVMPRNIRHWMCPPLDKVPTPQP